MAVLLHLLHLLFLHLLHLRHLEAAQLREDPHLHLNIAWQLSSTFFFTSSPTCSLIYFCSSHKIPRSICTVPRSICTFPHSICTFPRSICTFPRSICTCCCQPFFFLFFTLSILYFDSAPSILGCFYLALNPSPPQGTLPCSCLPIVVFLQKRANTTFSFSVLRTFASEYDLHLAVL